MASNDRFIRLQQRLINSAGADDSMRLAEPPYPYQPPNSPGKVLAGPPSASPQNLADANQASRRRCGDETPGPPSHARSPVPGSHASHHAADDVADQVMDLTGRGMDHAVGSIASLLICSDPGADVSA